MTSCFFCMPYADKERQRQAQHEHYLDHKDEYQARAREWKRKHRLQHRAARCKHGISYPLLCCSICKGMQPLEQANG